LNPSDPFLLQNLAFNYQMMRDFNSANKTIDRALQIDSRNLGLWEVKSKLAIGEKGDFSVAEKAFAAVKSFPISDEQKLKIATARADVYLLERKYREGLREAEAVPDNAIASLPGALGEKYYLIGFAQKALHQELAARASFLRSKAAIEEQLRRSPDSADVHIHLAKVLAHLGEKETALAEAQRASELQPEARDAFGGPEITFGVAEVYTILGDNSRAIEILERLLSRPSGVTVAGLKVGPIWDPLRSDSRFQALIDKYGSKA
jgi:tetratricopeptide (TPR) repeat protein